MNRLVRSIWGATKSVLLFGIAMLVVLTLLEGLSSVALFGYEALFKSEQGLRSRVHVEYDETLGWVNIPGLRMPDMYGAGVGLEINQQSFRNTEEFEAAVPNGRIRVICSGDSFTLGIGVANADTWCQRLESRERRFQTVNLGEAGYGVGQIYLKYEKLGKRLDHDLHVVAFIDDDIRRMRVGNFFGYGKPMPRMRSGEVVIENLPVPQAGYRVPWITHNVRLFNELRSVQFGRKVLGKLSPNKPDGMSPQEARDVAIVLFERLREANLQKGSTLVLLLLEQSMWGLGQREELSHYLELELGKRGFHFIDAAAVFRELPPEELTAMFDPEWAHYSVRGNEKIVDLLHRELLAIPEVAARLGTKIPERAD